MATLTTPVTNPKPFLLSLVGKEISVKLKWGMEYHGVLTCADAYLNLQLQDAEEYIDGASHGCMKELLIRCNNILYIREYTAPETSVIAKEEEEDD
ncbi:uncharacterized protein [Parasteatoda tepidariorum]|nr:probable small nuclear ribonucleoprotein F [Parasteatoda tepidariorum]